MNAQKNKTLHALLTATKLTGQKANLCLGASEDRTEHSSELTDKEADALIAYLEKQVPNRGIPGGVTADRLRKLLIAKGHNIGKHPNSVKAWCEKQGVNGVKKKFNDYTPQELRYLSEVFDKVVVHALEKTKKQMA